MPTLHYYEIQKAIYEKLIGNSALMAIISGVFDHVPQVTTYPFVSIGAASSADFSNISKNITDYLLNIDIWSREKGRRQAVQIMDMIYALLHNGSIVVAGQIVVSLRVLSTAIELENDGVTYHGKIRLKIILSST